VRGVAELKPLYLRSGVLLKLASRKQVADLHVAGDLAV